MRRLLVAALVLAHATIASGDPDPKRKVIVLEYRAASEALPGVAKRVVGALSKQTSLGVLGPDQTRAVFGDSLDQVLTKCAGESACVAKIGRKVGAAEVILVGISELGDVILTMQRIDVRRSSVSARVADSLAEGSAPSDAQVDAYLQKLLPAGDFKRFGTLDIVANLSGAAVSVGGQSRGMTPIEKLTLPAPAAYDIRVEKQGFVPFTTRVQLPPDGEIKVEAQLSLRGAAPSWYQRWYVLAAAGVLVAGAAGTTIYFATRDGGFAGDGRLPVTVVVQ